MSVFFCIHRNTILSLSYRQRKVLTYTTSVLELILAATVEAAPIAANADPAVTPLPSSPSSSSSCIEVTSSSSWLSDHTEGTELSSSSSGSFPGPSISGAGCGGGAISGSISGSSGAAIGSSKSDSGACSPANFRSCSCSLTRRRWATRARTRMSRTRMSMMIPTIPPVLRPPLSEAPDGSTSIIAIESLSLLTVGMIDPEDALVDSNGMVGLEGVGLIVPVGPTDTVGSPDGEAGETVGLLVTGDSDGAIEGDFVGLPLGGSVELPLGESVGLPLGPAVGAGLGIDLVNKYAIC
mmetsp:Transcript_20642/g.43069  ORF Transcript_20642/g.43069 Transcript_20642/m.43069 type:complete len:295 (-) Transcript_20642:880-1764(-)